MNHVFDNMDSFMPVSDLTKDNKCTQVVWGALGSTLTSSAFQ